jgi:hypothetical protein
MTTTPWTIAGVAIAALIVAAETATPVLSEVEGQAKTAQPKITVYKTPT